VDIYGNALIITKQFGNFNSKTNKKSKSIGESSRSIYDVGDGNSMSSLGAGSSLTTGNRNGLVESISMSTTRNSSATRATKSSKSVSNYTLNSIFEKLSYVSADAMRSEIKFANMKFLTESRKIVSKIEFRHILKGFRISLCETEMKLLEKRYLDGVNDKIFIQNFISDFTSVGRHRLKELHMEKNDNSNNNNPIRQQVMFINEGNKSLSEGKIDTHSRNSGPEKSSLSSQRTRVKSESNSRISATKSNVLGIGKKDSQQREKYATKSSECRQNNKVLEAGPVRKRKENYSLESKKIPPVYKSNNQKQESPSGKPKYQVSEEMVDLVSNNWENVQDPLTQMNQDITYVLSLRNQPKINDVVDVYPSSKLEDNSICDVNSENGAYNDDTNSGAYDGNNNNNNISSNKQDMHLTTESHYYDEDSFDEFNGMESTSKYKMKISVNSPTDGLSAQGSLTFQNSILSSPEGDTYEYLSADEFASSYCNDIGDDGDNGGYIAYEQPSGQADMRTATADSNAYADEEFENSEEFVS
jgi:hypothetical protein